MFSSAIASDIGLAARFSLGLVFLSAGTSKLLNLQAFWVVLIDYDLVALRVRRFLVVALPLCEIAVGVSWLLPIGTTMINLSSTLALLAVFCAAMFVNATKGRRINCGCSGILASDTIGWHSIARNIVLAIIAILSAFIPVATISWPSSVISLHSLLIIAVMAYVIWCVSLIGATVSWWIAWRGIRRRVHDAVISKVG
jgi:hypothetical protein